MSAVNFSLLFLFKTYEGDTMSQLKMYWLKGTPVADYELPEGYSIVR